MIKLYANVGIGHENDFEKIKKRIVSAAQCNADAIVINKSSPRIVIPENKKYVSITSKWGSLPYLEVAEKSEIDDLTVKKIYELIDHIGIPLIWSITDTEAGEWVIEKTPCRDIKIHWDSRKDWELLKFAVLNFDNIIYGGHCNTCKQNIKMLLDDYLTNTNKRKRLSLYHTANKLPAEIEEIQLGFLDQYRLGQHNDIKIGYEGRTPDIFPDCAIVFKNVDFIEKYLGDDDSEGAILSPEKFYDFFVNMNQLEIANG